MAVAVVLIIDNADVRRAMVLPQVCAHRDEILGLAPPAAVIVETELAAELPRALDHRQQLRGCFLDLLVARQSSGRAGDGDPNLRMQLVFLKKPEGGVVRAPKGKILQSTLLIFEDFLLELRHMLRAPVVGDLSEADFLDHLGAFGRPAFHRIERHDTPGDDVLVLEQRRRFGCSEFGK